MIWHPYKNQHWIILGIIAALMVVAAVGLSVWPGAFLRSEAFRTMCARAVGSGVGAKVALSPFRWERATLHVERLAGTGVDGSPLEALVADQVRAEWNWRAAFSGVWRIERIDVFSLQLALMPPSASGPASVTASHQPTRLAALLPQRFEFESVSGALTNPLENLFPYQFARGCTLRITRQYVLNAQRG